MMNKKTLPILTAALVSTSVAVNAQNIKISETAPAIQLEALGMSGNHQYICGLNVATYRGFIWDTENDIVAENGGDYANCDFRGVTNEGKAYGIIGLDDMVTTNASVFGMDGAIETIEEEMSQIFAVTPDGTIAVGCLLDDMWLPTACVWKNGVRTILPCPTDEECGFMNDGANAQFVSADGKVIAGYLQDWHSARPAIIWRLQDDGTYVADVISKDIWELNDGEGKPYRKFEPLGISANGQWLCLAGQHEGVEGFTTPEFMIRMNLETGEIFESALPATDEFDPETEGYYPNNIANDGTCIGVLANRAGLIWRAGTDTPVLLREAFPSIERFEEYDFYHHAPIAISSDAKYIAGYALPFFEDEYGMLDYNFESYLLCIDEEAAVPSIRTHTFNNTRAYDLTGRNTPADSKGLIIKDNILKYNK